MQMGSAIYQHPNTLQASSTISPIFFMAPTMHPLKCLRQLSYTACHIANIVWHLAVSLCTTYGQPEAIVFVLKESCQQTDLGIQEEFPYIFVLSFLLFSAA